MSVHYSEQLLKLIAMNFQKLQCAPLPKNALPLTMEVENTFFSSIPEGWQIDRKKGPHRLSRQFIFGDFNESVAFINKVAIIANEEGHHPDIKIEYNKVTLELWTHDIEGLSENDFILASKISAI